MKSIRSALRQCGASLIFRGQKSKVMRVLLSNLSQALLLNATGAKTRVQRLRELHFEQRLCEMSNDVELDVRDRVKTALEQFARVQAS